jgi:multidrug/hemolysin transport system permease protein
MSGINAVLSLTRRNILLFYRDKSAVFFSFLGAIIILALYILFLRENYLTGMGSNPGATAVIDGWMMAGVVAVTSVTTAGVFLQCMVRDRSTSITNDFLSSPAKPAVFTAGYILSTFLVSLVMSLSVMVLALIYLFSNGAAIPAGNILLAAGVLFPSVLSASGIMFFLASFIKTEAAYGGFNTMVGTMMGFVTGTYIPVGFLPGSVRAVVGSLPASHAAMILRDLFGGGGIDAMFSGDAVAANVFRDTMGFDLYVGGFQMEPWTGIAVMLISAVAFFALGTCNVRRRRA